MQDEYDDTTCDILLSCPGLSHTDYRTAPFSQLPGRPAVRDGYDRVDRSYASLPGQHAYFTHLPIGGLDKQRKSCVFLFLARTGALQPGTSPGASIPLDDMRVTDTTVGIHCGCYFFFWLVPLSFHTSYARMGD